MKGKSDAKWRMTAAKMPPLHRTENGQSYSIEKDKVYSWIGKQPEIIGMVFAKMRDEGLIMYDKETGTWRGRDYEA